MAADQSLFGLLAYGQDGYGDEFVNGVILTFELSICSYAIGFCFGLLGAGAKLSTNKWLYRIGDFYTTIVRALPELLLIVLIYYTGTSVLRQLLLATGQFSQDVEVPPFAAAICALGFIYGAYLTEILRGAILAIPKGQGEAGKAFGMSPSLRFRRIIFPQMIRYAVPGMGNQWLNITKDSALISVLGGFAETLFTGKMAASATKEYLFFYSVAGFLFLCITIASMVVLRRVETYANRGVRRM